MILENHTEIEFQQIKTDTINRFNKSFRKATMKEINVDSDYTICYITSLFETRKIVFDRKLKTIIISTVFASDLHEIEQLQNQLKEDKINELLRTL